MIFDLRNEYERDKFKEYVNKLYSKTCVVDIKEKKPNRSLAQNSYLHCILAYFACEYGCSTDEAKVLYYKREANREIFERTHVNGKGIEVKYLRSSSDLTTEEMSLSIERFRNYASAKGGIYLPAPHENEFLLHVQKLIEQNKEYI